MCVCVCVCVCVYERERENMLEEKAGDRKKEKREMHWTREIPPQLPEPSERLVSWDVCTRFR